MGGGLVEWIAKAFDGLCMREGGGGKRERRRMMRDGFCKVGRC